MFIEDTFDANKLTEFLAVLITDAGKKVFLILYNLRLHHSKVVKAWVAQRKDQIELFYLPSYSPQLNPQERLNADLKCALVTYFFAHSFIWATETPHQILDRFAKVYSGCRQMAKDIKAQGKWAIYT